MADPTRKRVGRPANGPQRGPKRNLRAGPLWDACAQLAEQRGEPMTELVLRALMYEYERLTGYGYIE